MLEILWTDGKKKKKDKTAPSDCSNIHNNGEQHKENKIKEPSSNVMYSIWSIWD